MEVLNASAPGARVRVLRAAYHSTSGPGVPASSYMLQSSRRVISSGYNFVEPTSLPSKPLEISSVPLEIAIETESNGDSPNYKVTEPDDTEISEPSKWRNASGKNSIRFPSEESSSTDNASIIDLDSRSQRSNSVGKHAFDNTHENQKASNLKNNRVSPLLDAPVTLSTLKYKSLLNGSDDWNNRRKSYSFEDTMPLNKNVLERIDRFAIESSTDSGICKSSEVVNDIENTRYHKTTKERKSAVQDETFKDWLVKNRINQSHMMRPLKERSITPDRLSENNITLQSPGKVCITLPVTIEAEDDHTYKKPQNSDENDRKSKKVEFCKTELHFAVDTGTVNIIATDEKPPPTNDFRRRRSVFVPIRDRFERSVTLFGEKTDFNERSKVGFFSSTNAHEISDSDENTAATKSILKNKIPKPKPYLLGENMILGKDDGVVNKSVDKNTSVTGVSLINSQLKADKKYCREIRSDYSSPKHSSTEFASNSYRSTNEGTFTKDSLRKPEHNTVQTNKKLETVSNTLSSSIKTRLQVLQTSPSLGRSNTRQLRESDLTYFGVEKNQMVPTPTHHEDLESSLYDNYNEQEEIFESVRLVRKASSSVCSSEIESDEAPEYQNIPSKLSYTPVPAPRLRTKYSINQSDSKTGNLNSIKEQENDDNVPATSRRSRLRKDSSSPLNRSISEPPKIARLRHREVELRHKTNNTSISASSRTKSIRSSNIRESQEGTLSEDSTLYVNLTPRGSITNDQSKEDYKSSSKRKVQSKKETNARVIKGQNTERPYAQRTHRNEDNLNRKPERRSDSTNSKTNTCDTSQLPTKTSIQRTKKLVTPELSSSDSRRAQEKSHKANENYGTSHKGKDHHIKYLHHHSNSDKSHSNTLKTEIRTRKEPRRERNTPIVNETYDTKQNKYSLVNNNNLNNISPTEQPEVHINLTSKVKEIENKYHDPKKTRRSEYVINYDDKNGTVSSVRKLKPLKLSSDPKKNSAKANKENSNEQNGRMKQLNKIALQQIAEQQRDLYEKGYMDQTSKRKTHVHKACQLL